jgi:hypothetical protein
VGKTKSSLFSAQCPVLTLSLVSWGPRLVCRGSPRLSLAEVTSGGLSLETTGVCVRGPLAVCTPYLTESGRWKVPSTSVSFPLQLFQGIPGPSSSWRGLVRGPPTALLACPQPPHPCGRTVWGASRNGDTAYVHKKREPGIVDFPQTPATAAHGSKKQEAFIIIIIIIIPIVITLS